MPKRYSTAIAINKLLVQNWEQELSFPYFSVASFLESHNFYLTIVFIYISWRITYWKWCFWFQPGLKYSCFQRELKCSCNLNKFSPGWNFNPGWISTRLHVTATLESSLRSSFIVTKSTQFNVTLITSNEIPLTFEFQRIVF